MNTVRALIVATRQDYVATDFTSLLHGDARTPLVVAEPVSVDMAMTLLTRHADVAVALLICLKGEIERDIALLKELRPELNIVCVPIGGSASSVTLSNPSRTVIVEIISLLLNQNNATENSPRGKVLIFPSLDKTAPGAGGRAVTVIQGRSGTPIDKNVLATLDAALAWIDAATNALLDVWSLDRGTGPNFTIKLDALRTWLQRFARIETASTLGPDRAFNAFLASLDGQDARDTPLGRIARLLDYDALSLKFFLIVLAPELDIRFHRSFGSMHDDLARRNLSVALACAILAAATANARPLDIRAQLAGLHQLHAARLIDGLDGGIPAADTPLGISAAVVDWILSGNPAGMISSLAIHSLATTQTQPASALLPAARRDEVLEAVCRATRAREPLKAIVLTGSDPGWLQAEALAAAGDELWVKPGNTSGQGALNPLMQAARLSGKRLVVDVSDKGPAAEELWAALVPLLVEQPDPPIVLASEAAPLLAAAPGAAIAVVHLPAPSIENRRSAVLAALETVDEAPSDEQLVADLAGRFRLPLNRLGDAIALARASAAQEHRTAPNATDLRAGFRAAAGSHLPEFARRVEPTLCPDQADAMSCLKRVVLPKAQQDQLVAIVEHVRFSGLVLNEWGFGARLDAKGVSVLFSGVSGTGKTMAAHALASALEADLYVVDLARIVSKYIGETEKNLDTIFDEAERAGAVLLFDEAEALFGKRSAVRDSHDRYANMEVAYLLQRMERFDGLAVLTTNHPENVDPAFTRRLRFSIEFPRPDPAARLKIWEQSIPGDYRDCKLDLSFLARRLDLTGGSIRQVALHAAMAAARDSKKRIDQDHVQQATRTELIRLGAFADLGQLLERVA